MKSAEVSQKQSVASTVSRRIWWLSHTKAPLDARLSANSTAQPLPKGATQLTMRFAVEKMGGPAQVTLSAKGNELARVDLANSLLLAAGNGETLDVGRDLGVPVTRYRTEHGAIEGDVRRVSFDFD